MKVPVCQVCGKKYPKTKLAQKPWRVTILSNSEPIWACSKRCRKCFDKVLMGV